MEAVSRTPATLDQVARAAGVSGKTASRVFDGSAQVSDETRRAVERAAAELGYVPVRAASGARAGHSESVGVVVPEPGSRLFTTRCWRDCCVASPTSWPSTACRWW